MDLSINIKSFLGQKEETYDSDESIIEGVLAGDQRASKVLYERFAPKMFSICKRYTAKIEDAKDLMHDGFIQVFTKIHTFKGNSKLETWITRVMINNAINAIKKQIMVEWNDDTMGNEPDFDLDYESLHRKDHEYDAVLRLIHQLPMGYRTILNLYAVEQFSHKEISEMLNISEGTSKSQLNRARAALKKLLRKEGWDETSA